jgi:hypothetical protein
MAAPSRTLKLSILGDVDDLLKSLKKGTNATDDYTKNLANFGKKAAAAFAIAGAAAGAFALSAVKGASDLAETLSKVGVLFGDTAKDIEKFAGSAAKSLGQTKQQALDAAATFATFGKAAGLSGQDLSNFSIDFVKLASDLASFNNTSPEQAINAIGSALRGEAEPLRAYGVLLDDASLRQAALSLGIIKTTKEALTPQQKVLAAQKLIFEQTGAAQGDFARTSDGLANQTKILTAQLENMKTEIGTALLPIVLQLATAFADNVIPQLQAFVAGLTGKNGLIEATEAGAAGAFKFGEMVGNVMKTVYEFKDVLIATAAIIASIFVVSKISAGVVATIALIKSLIMAYNALKASALVAGVASAFALNPLLGVGAVALAATVLSAANALANRSTGNVDLGDGTRTPFEDTILGGGLGIFGGGSSGGGGGIPGFPSVPGSSGGGVGGALGGGVGGFGGSASSPRGAKSLLDLVDRLTDVSDELTDLTFLVETGGINRKQGQKELDALVKEFDVLSKQADRLTKGTSGSTGSNNLTGFNPNQGGTVVNISVNGAIDPEGTARTIADTMNNSFYRGTGGALNFAGLSA